MKKGLDNSGNAITNSPNRELPKLQKINKRKNKRSIPDTKLSSEPKKKRGRKPKKQYKLSKIFLRSDFKNPVFLLSFDHPHSFTTLRTLYKIESGCPSKFDEYFESNILNLKMIKSETTLRTKFADLIHFDSPSKLEKLKNTNSAPFIGKYGFMVSKTKGYLTK